MVDSAFPLSEVLRWTSAITGKTVTQNRETLIDLIRETIDVLHAEESTENLRKWCIPSCGCVVTIPKEMETPVKYRIGDKVGPVRNFTYQFHGYTRYDCTGYNSDLRYIKESPIFFDLPKHGARVAARAVEYYTPDCKPEDLPYLIVQGYNTAGQLVSRMTDDGHADIGEKIYISQPDQAPEYSEQVFSSITSVRVVGEVNTMLVWCNVTEYGKTPNEYGLLSIYDRGDELPSFRRYELAPVLDSSCCYEIEVLGHLRKPMLKYDNELIRGYDANTLRSMIRAKHAQSSNDINGATFNASLAMGSLRKQNEKQQNEADNIQIFAPTAPGNFPRGSY